MTMGKSGTGAEELRAAFRSVWGIWLIAGVFSFFANLLMLTGPIYMLQIYDRVLGSGSVETLVSLTLIAGFLFAVMGILDVARTRLLSRTAARFQQRLEARALAATTRHALRHPGTAASGNRDLETIRTMLASPAITAGFDAPWTPIFVIGIAVFHPWLAALGVAGGGVMILITLLSQWTTRRVQSIATQTSYQTEGFADQFRSNADTIAAMGLAPNLTAKVTALRANATAAQLHATDLSTGFATTVRVSRVALQSAMLGLGAYLVLTAGMTPGGMIAASILLGRALAPVETLIGQWTTVQRGLAAWTSLSELLTDAPPTKVGTPLPAPRARLDVTDLTVVPPAQSKAALRMLSFSLGPGQAIGVIGPSGSGKSTLAKTLCGLWPAAGGSVRLDGARLDHYAPEQSGQHIGYLPQTIQFLHGTIAENISGFDAAPDPKAIHDAARIAGAHDLILSLPDGYDTILPPGGTALSGGQAQRIALARAVYGDPCLVILDEPNAHLDHDGEQALNRAILHFKAAGKAVIVMAHRPAAIQLCDAILVLDQGRRTAFGPKEQILRDPLHSPSPLPAAGQR